MIFEAHPEQDRHDALNFDELLKQRASRHRLSRQRKARAVSDISERIADELEKQRLLGGLRTHVRQKRELVERYTADRSKLVSPGSEKRAERHAEIAKAANEITQHLRGFANQRRTFLTLQDEVQDFRQNGAPEALRQTQSCHPESGMSDNQWAAFLLDYTGNVDGDLGRYIEWVDGKIAGLQGTPPPVGDPHTPLIDAEADLSALPQAVLQAEMARLEKLVGADKDTQRKYSAVSKTIARETAELTTLTTRLDDYEGAMDRAHELNRDREDAYGRAFDALEAEEAVLEHLYRPLMIKLSGATGTLKKLSFSVTRSADVEASASRAEDGLIDLRKQGPFRGRGRWSRSRTKSSRTLRRLAAPTMSEQQWPNSAGATKKTSSPIHPCRANSMPSSAHGRSYSPSGYSVQTTSKSSTASRTMAWTSAGSAPELGGSFCSCFTSPSTTPTGAPS